MNGLRPRVLVTGFVPNDTGVNASQLLVESMAAETPGPLGVLQHNIAYAILPGDTNVLGDALVTAIEEHRPDLCLLVGQDPGGRRIKFERIATNLRDFMVPDAAGNMEVGSRIVIDAPAAYFSTLDDPARLACMLEKHGIPATPSNHAGNHLCNQALFLALHFSAMSSSSMRSGFMHVPRLASQVVGRWDDSGSMPLEMLRDALTYAIQFVVDGWVDVTATT
jgi:pyroglutamyl-peptidase